MTTIGIRGAVGRSWIPEIATAFVAVVKVAMTVKEVRASRVAMKAEH